MVTLVVNALPASFVASTVTFMKTVASPARPETELGEIEM
jgi:hypothetical protein